MNPIIQKIKAYPWLKISSHSANP